MVLASTPQVLLEIRANPSDSLSLPAAARRCGDISPSTVFRWIVDGLARNGKKHRLEAYKFAGRWKTSIQALDRFLTLANPEANSNPAPFIEPTTVTEKAGAASALLGFWQMMGAAIGVWLAATISHQAMFALGIVLMVASLLAFGLYTMRAKQP